MFAIFGQATFGRILMVQGQEIVVRCSDDFEECIAEKGFVEGQLVENLSESFSLAVCSFNEMG